MWIESLVLAELPIKRILVIMIAEFFDKRRIKIATQKQASVSGLLQMTIFDVF